MMMLVNSKCVHQLRRLSAGSNEPRIRCDRHVVGASLVAVSGTARVLLWVTSCRTARRRMPFFAFARVH